MTEKELENGQAQPKSQTAGETGDKPCAKQPEPQDTLESSAAQLPPRMPVKVEYQPRPPLHPLSEPPPHEPHRHIPVVPPGPFEPDKEDSPPLDFDEQQTDVQPCDPEQTD